ncbi:MAG: hypothetical protein ACK4GC_08760 [Paracoccaceae bacterium]
MVCQVLEGIAQFGLPRDGALAAADTRSVIDGLIRKIYDDLLAHGVAETPFSTEVSTEVRDSPTHALPAQCGRGCEIFRDGLPDFLCKFPMNVESRTMPKVFTAQQ